MLPEKGAKLIEIAKSYVGSHYLNGSYGEIPGEPGSGWRPRGLKLIRSHSRLDPKYNYDNPKLNIAVSAAEMTVKTYCVCAGSWATIKGGRPADANAPDLNNYLNTLRSTSDTSLWMPFFQRFTPRRAFGPGQNGALVWGESCTGIHHFDCITYINCCLMELKGSEYTFEILQWRDNPAMTGSTVYALGSLNSSFKLEDGDILIKTVPHEHIAFVSKDGQVFQAADTDLGVISSEKGAFSPSSRGDWTHLARVH